MADLLTSTGLPLFSMFIFHPLLHTKDIVYILNFTDSNMVRTWPAYTRGSGTRFPYQNTVCHNFFPYQSTRFHHTPDSAETDGTAYCLVPM